MTAHTPAFEPPVLALVGLGAGRGDIGEAALSRIEEAEALCGWPRHLALFPEHARKARPLPSPLDTALLDVDRLSRERRTVLLASGDPFFFGVGGRLAALLGPARILSFPAVTSIQALFSRLCEPWENVRAVSLHGRGAGNFFPDLRAGRKVACLTDPAHTPAVIARMLIDGGFEAASMVVGEDLGCETERVTRLTPHECASREFSALNVVALFPQPAEALPVFGLPDDTFLHEAGLITKMEMRVVALALLALSPGQVMWDVGSASASVSIEAARMAALAGVYAVEAGAGRALMARGNARRFGCGEVVIAHGRAPEAFSDFPDPDRVFVGGSGGSLRAILSEASRRLAPGGRIVVSAATLETLEAARAFFAAHPYDVGVTEINASRSAPVGGAVRLSPLNPVFFVTAQRKDH